MTSPQIHPRRAPAARWPAALLCLLLAAAAPPAPAADPQEVYRRAIEAFNGGAYEQALAGFIEARRGGVDDPRLSYNLGASYYKLGQYPEARAAFLELVDDPGMAELAFYNLGLVAVRQDDLPEAERWFRRVLAEGSSPKLRGLARAGLERIGNAASPGPRPAPLPWYGFLKTDLGYDSNVALRSEAETLVTSAQDDAFLNLFAYGGKRVSGNREEGLSVNASAYARHHIDLGSYNVEALGLEAVFDRRLDRWLVSPGLDIAYTFVNGHGFTRTATLSVEGRRRLAANQRLRLRYGLSRIDETGADYAYLAGLRQQARVESLWRWSGKRLRLSYQLETNDREDLATPRFTSYSPTRHSLRAQGAFDINSNTEATLEARYRYSRYRDPSMLVDGSRVRRTDDRYRLIGRLERRIARGREVSAEYRYTDNNSNLPDKDYHRHEFAVGLLIPW